MADKSNIDTSNVPAEQLAYAKLLSFASLTGIIVLAISFLIYVLGILPPLVEPEVLVQHWHLKAQALVSELGTPTGWSWLSYLGKGDYLNFIGIAVLAGATVIGYTFILLPAYLKRKDYTYAILVALEIIVLSLAASGILQS